MNAQEYIASGLLEAYVYGILPEAEAADVERAIIQYPEVKAEVAAIEETMLHLATEGAVNPPAHLKEDIWNAINSGEQKTIVPPAIPEPVIPSQQPITSKTIPLQRSPFAWQMAAAIAVLIASLIGNVVLMNSRNKAEQQALALQQRMDTLSKEQQQLATIVRQHQHEAEMISDPEMKSVVMQTMQKDHPMAATLYWNKSKSVAYVSVQKLPAPPDGMQYQLWAIADGKPVDLGVLTNETIGKQGMEKVSKAVTDGQAFAISLEKAGGSPVPTMERIYVMGKVI